MSKNEQELDALFGATNARSREMAHRASHHVRGSANHGKGRLLPSSDFGVKQERKEIGVPSIGMAPPGQGGTGAGPGVDSVEQRRQLYGLAVNNRSNQIVFNADTPHTQNIPVIQLSGTTDETDTLLVQLGGPTFLQTPVVVPGGGGSSPSVGFGSIQAALQWGVGNVQFSAQVDWVQGAIFSLPANYLAVNALVPLNDPARVQFGTTAMMSAGVAVSYGAPAEHRNRARLTQFLGRIMNGNSSAAVPIPAFATSFGILSSSDTSTAQITLSSFIANAAAAETWLFDYTNETNTTNQGADIFPIPNNARSLTLTDTTGGGTHNWYVLWDICF